MKMPMLLFICMSGLVGFTGQTSEPMVDRAHAVLTAQVDRLVPTEAADPDKNLPGCGWGVADDADKPAETLWRKAVRAERRGAIPLATQLYEAIIASYPNAQCKDEEFSIAGNAAYRLQIMKCLQMRDGTDLLFDSKDALAQAIRVAIKHHLDGNSNAAARITALASCSSEMWYSEGSPGALGPEGAAKALVWRLDNYDWDAAQLEDRESVEANASLIAKAKESSKDAGKSYSLHFLKTKQGWLWVAQSKD